MSTLSQSSSRKRGPRYKLSNARALELRQDYERGHLTVEAIADKYEVTNQTVYNVLRRLSQGGAQ